MEVKRLSFAFNEVKADDDARTVEGFASVFNNLDSYSDIVMPGAFAKSIAKRKPVMLWQHNSDKPIGVWDEMEEQKKGLYVKGRILDTSLGDDAYKLVKAGAITGMSIGYAARKWETDTDKGIRKLTEIDLYEVSLVTFPANEKALITRVKSEDGAFMTERDFEEFLRDAGGLSHKEAKIVVSEGYKALLKHRDGGAEEQTVLRELRDVLTNFRI
jgi:HK97 family phage prohead protease